MAKMLRSPVKQYNSDSDLTQCKDSESIIHRKRKQGDDDFYEMFQSLAMEMRNWKSEIHQDITDIKTSLDSGLQELRSEISSVRQEHIDIRNTVQALNESNNATKQHVVLLEEAVLRNSTQCDELENKVGSLTDNAESLSNLEQKFEELSRSHEKLQIELNASNQRDRLTNLEIVGVPESREENIVGIVISIAANAGVEISSEDILEANRITPRTRLQGRPRNIIVKVNSRVIKDNIISGVRKNRITTKNLGMPGVAKPVYVNEHLTFFNKNLLKKAKEAAKLRNFQYVWIRHGRIFVRKTDGSPPIQIISEMDISKIN